MRSTKVGVIVAGIFVLAMILAACSGGKPVAIVNGQRITDQEVTKRVPSSVKTQALMQIILPMLYESEARKLGTRVTDQEVEAVLQQEYEASGGKEQFERRIKDQGLTLEEVRALVHASLCAEAIRTRNVKLTDDQLKKYFEDHLQRWDKPAEVKLHQLVVNTRPEAQAIRDQLAGIKDQKALVDKFDQLAQEKSSGFYRAQAGDRGWIKITQLPPSVQDKVLALSAGQLSEPLEIDYGLSGTNKPWALYYVEEKKPEVKPEFEKVRLEVTREAKGEDPAAELPMALQQRLLGSARIEILSPDYEMLKQQLTMMRSMPPGPGIGPGGPAKVPPPTKPVPSTKAPSASSKAPGKTPAPEKLGPSPAPSPAQPQSSPSTR